MSLPEGRVDDTPRRRTPGDLVRAFAPPLRSPRFWVLQLMVFAIGALHDLLLVWLRDRDATLAVPPPVTSALFFIPVLYAALSFGVEGGVGTALLSTALLVPHWFLPDAMTPMHVWMEGGNLLVLNAVAVIVGKRVEHERRDRMRAERARGLAEMATSRYHALFGNHPSPVIITTASGRITETNEAAMRVFGDATTGRDLASLLGISLQALIDGSPRLEITTIEGEERLFVPDAHAISVGMSAELVQVCLVDITEQQRRQDEQRMFGVRLLEVQEEERRRIARELHDDPLQTLMFLSRELDDVAGDARLPDALRSRIAEHAGLVGDVGQVLRRVIRALRPPVLDDLGLVAALRQLTTEAASRPDAPIIQLHVAGEPARLPAQTELMAYRVVQESLSNVLRHADAGRADVRVEFGADLSITIADNGRGIPLTPLLWLGRHSAPTFGLIGMRERVVAAGGRLEITPRASGGTVVQVHMPRGAELSAAVDAASAALN